MMNVLKTEKSSVSPDKFFVCLLVCLFGVLLHTREFFTHMETSPLPVNDILTYTRHSLPLGSEDTLPFLPQNYIPLGWGS